MISKSMNAVVKTKAQRGAEYMRVDVPDVGPEEVLVKVEVCAICGTDLHMFQWNRWAAENVIRSYGGLPRVMGHEFSGEVVKTGQNVTRVKVGDRIAAETHIPCGTCFLCRTERRHNCLDIRRFKDGVFADYALIPDFSAQKIPEDIPSELACLFEPFGVAVHGASLVRMVGDTVAVIGSGPIGLFSILMAKSMGASTIFATDISEYRLELAKKAGAHFLFNPQSTDVVSEIRTLTNGEGVGVVIETSGNVKAVKQGFEILRKCGSCVMIGLPSEPLILDAAPDIVWKEARVYGVHGRENFASWEIAKNLLKSGTIDLTPYITHRFPFDRFEEAFSVCESGRSGKVILYPPRR